MKKRTITAKHVITTAFIVYLLFLTYTLISDTFELSMLVPLGLFILSEVVSKIEQKKKLFEIKISKDV